MAQSHLSPGISFVFESLRQLSIPISAAVAATFGLSCILSTPATYHLAALFFPGYICIRRVWNYIVEERDRAALGAVRVPVKTGNWPGGLDLLLDRLKAGKNGYPFANPSSLAGEYGKTFSMNILGETRIVTCNPDHVKAMLSTDFSNWEKGDIFRNQMGSVLGSGVFNSDGDMWRFHRSMTRPIFSRDRISDFDIFAKHADEALYRIGTHAGSAFDFQDLVSRFTLDSATEFLFGSCVHSLQAEDPPPFGLALGRVQHQLAQRSRTAPIWPLLEFFHDKTSDDMKVIHQFIQPIMEEAQRRRAHTKSTGKKELDAESGVRLTLLDELIDLTDDPNVIADEIVNILIAGRDTTASALTFMTYCLALDQDVLRRLRSEILEQVGHTRYPDADDVRQMKYLRAVINETLRLYPPVPGNVRTAIRSTTLPASTPGGKPFYIPANTKVPYVTLHIHRSTEYWGPDAENFDPERFLDERMNKYILANPFIFLPFNGGPRICLGQQFAYQEISFFIIRLLQMFDHIELASDAQPTESLPPASWANGKGRQSVERIRPKSDLTMSVVGGLWVRMRATGARG